jgi:hypothetical protein
MRWWKEARYRCALQKYPETESICPLREGLTQRQYKMVTRIKSAVLASSTKALVVGVMVGALLVATAGFVVAQSSTVITGCIQKQTSLLKIPSSGSCDPKNETAISWNQVGPQGPQGPQGETGATGPPGPAGTSAAYVTGPNYRFLEADQPPIPVAEFTSLPAGKYLITISMELYNFSDHLGSVECLPSPQPPKPTHPDPLGPYSYHDRIEPGAAFTGPNDYNDVMSFTFALELPSEQPVSVRCRGGDVGADHIAMTALQVENLTRQ